MKNITTRSAATFALASAALITTLVSCTGNTGDERGTLGINSIPVAEVLLEDTRNYTSATDDSVKTYFTIVASAQWPERIGNYNIAPLQDTIIHLLTVDADPQKGIYRAIASFVENPSAAFEEGAYTRVDSVPLSPFSYRVETRGKVLELNNRFISYQIGLYTFLGGAHPDYGTVPFTYDLKQARVVDFDYLFVPGSQNEIVSLIRDELAARADCPADNLLAGGYLTDDIFPSSSIFVSGGAIIFHYNPYAIGPHSMGMIDVELYAPQVSDYLTDSAKLLLGLNSWD